MPATPIAALLQKIDRAIEEKRTVEALRLILTNFGKLPDAAPLRERVAHLLASRGKKREAVGIYELIARHYANAGYPARCLAAIKQMNALQPDTTVLLDHFSALYSVRSPYLKTDLVLQELPEPDGPLDVSAKEPQVAENELMRLTVERAAQRRGLAAQPNDLPPLPLLSVLPTETLRRVLDFISFEIFAEFEPILDLETAYGELIWTVSTDIVLESSPKLGVEKERAAPAEAQTHRLPPGTLIGLGSFGPTLTPPRVRVLASKGSEILRMTKEGITTLSREFDDFINRIHTLRRHAWVEQFATEHPLFNTLESEEARTELISHFAGVQIDRGDRIIAQNTPSPGLFVIIDGHIETIRQDKDGEITVDTLSSGAVLGESGLGSDDAVSPTSAVATSSTTLAFLPRQRFRALEERHHGLGSFVEKLEAQRRRDLDNALSSQDLKETE